MEVSKGPAKVPRCAPASAPCATMASTPACSSSCPSRTVVAVPNTTIPRSFKRRNASTLGIPNVKLNTVGRSSSTTSNCAGKGSAGMVGSTGGGSSNVWWTSVSRASMGRASNDMRGSMPPANKFMWNGFRVSVRVFRMASRICAGVMYAAPSEPSPPASETAAASSGVPGPPPIGAKRMGYSMPSDSRSAFFVMLKPCRASKV